MWSLPVRTPNARADSTSSAKLSRDGAESRRSYVEDVVGIARVEQVPAEDQALPRAQDLRHRVLERLEPMADTEGVEEPGLGGLGLMTARFAHRENPAHQTMPGPVVLPEGADRVRDVADRTDQRPTGPVLRPHPRRLQGQPGHDRLVAEECGRHQPVDQRALASRAGSVMSARRRSSASSVSSIHRYSAATPSSISGVEPIATRDLEAELPQLLEPEFERLTGPTPDGQAAHLDQRRLRSLLRAGAEPVDRPVEVVGLVQSPHAVQRGVTTGVQLDERGGVGRVGELGRGRQEFVHQRLVAQQLCLFGGAAEHSDHQAPLVRLGYRVDDRQVLLRRDVGELRPPAQPPGQVQADSVLPTCAQPVKNGLLHTVVTKPHRLLGARFQHQ